MSKVEVNEIRPQCGTTVTLGGAGETVALGACASATGFSTPCMSWCSSIKTAGFTAAAGNGYFINTCGGAFEVTLPATASVGDQINFTDFARTWGTGNLTLCTNSLKFQGNTTPKPVYDTDGATVKIVYSGTTQGWIPQLDKGTTLETPQTYNLQYMVVAGGASGGGGTPGGAGAGGGAGGLRTVATKSFTVCKGATIPITVGGGGAAPTCASDLGGNGVNSVFSTITSAGGGAGGSGNDSGPTAGGGPNPTPDRRAGQAGGSGGGSRGSPGITGGAGNTPPTPCTQGYEGGHSPPPAGGGGGGGHGAVGSGGTGSPEVGGAGGAGTVNGIRGTPFDPVAYAGGGGGSGYGNPSGCATGGAGGGAQGGGGTQGAGGTGGTNTGGGGGSGFGPGTNAGGAGGSGIVILRRVTACSTSTSGTVTTCGSDTIHTFTGDGSFVA